jgi:hypothetical protein
VASGVGKGDQRLQSLHGCDPLTNYCLQYCDIECVYSP